MVKSKFIFSYISKDENGIYRDMTSPKATGIVEYLPSHKVFHNRLLEILKQLCLSSYFQKIPVICSLFQCIFANLNAYLYEADTTYFLLLPSTSVSKLSIIYLKHFHKKHPNVKLFPILTDSMHASSPHMNYVRKKLLSDVWEKVLTFDKNDADEYGFTWFGYSWYSTFDDVEPANSISDLFYVGYKKGKREGLICDVYEEALKHGVKCDFRIVANENGIIKDGCELTYTQSRFPYPEIVSIIKSTGCILEVLQEGQDTQTIKYYEAIAYNKKLLTNNKHIIELPFYDNTKMQFFDTVDDIDWDWLTNKSDVHYEYTGEFTPLNIISFLKNSYCLE